MSTTFKQVKNNARSLAANGALNNVTSPLTFSVSSGEGARFPTIAAAPNNVPFYVTAWDKNKYPDPGDDPKMRIGLCTARSTDSLTVTWGQLGTPTTAITGRPAIELLVLDKHLQDIHTAVNALEATLVDATLTVKGIIKLAGDFAGTAALPRYKGRREKTIGPEDADYIVDGSNDDLVIQDAIDTESAAGGGKLVLRRSLYDIWASIIPKDNVFLESEVPFAAVFRLKDSVNVSLMKTGATGVDNWGMSGITFDGNRTNQSGGDVSLVNFGAGSGTLKNLFIDRIYIKDSYKHGLFVHGDQSGESIQLIQNSIVDNHGSVSTVGYGLYSDYNPTTIFLNNHIKNSNGNDGIEIGHLGAKAIGNYLYDGQLQFPFGDNSVIANNTLRENVIQNDVNTANDIIISGNHVLNATPAAGFAGITVYGLRPVIFGNHVKVTTRTGIRVFQATGARIYGNNVDGTDKATGGTNGIYSEQSNNVAIYGNTIRRFATGIVITHDHNQAYLNHFDDVTTGISLSDSSSSGHVIVDAQIGPNDYSGAATPIDAHNQTSYSVYGQLNGTFLIGATSAAYSAIGAAIQPGAGSKDSFVFDQYGTGKAFVVKSSGTTTANMAKDGTLNLGVNGWIVLNGGQGTIALQTTLSVANELSIAHSGATGAAATLTRSGNSASVIKNLILTTSNAGAGGATALSVTAGAVDLAMTDSALIIPRLTTTQKNALTAVNGMIVYDSTLNKFQGYENGAWTSFI